jgi:hypothetical protein
MSSNFFKPTRRDVLRAGTGLLVMAPHAARSQAADAVRFSLEFRIYGGNAPGRNAGFSAIRAST